MRTSYTVTLPEEPLAAPFPGFGKELRSRAPLPRSLLLSTFVGLLLNKAKDSQPVASQDIRTQAMEPGKEDSPSS